jgi:hypothetical protein
MSIGLLVNAFTDIVEYRGLLWVCDALAEYMHLYSPLFHCWFVVEVSVLCYICNTEAAGTIEMNNTSIDSIFFDKQLNKHNIYKDSIASLLWSKSNTQTSRKWFANWNFMDFVQSRYLCSWLKQYICFQTCPKMVVCLDARKTNKYNFWWKTLFWRLTYG